MSHLPRSRKHILLALASALILAMGSVGSTSPRRPAPTATTR